MIDTNRLLKGFEYFWNIPPSKQSPANWAYLKKWLYMLKEASQVDPNKPLEGKDLETVAGKIFGA